LRISRLASLNGFRTGRTCSTPGIAASGSACSLFSSPMTPMIVRCSPRLTCDLNPSSWMRSRMWSICCGVEPGCTTMIMVRVLDVGARNPRSASRGLELMLPFRADQGHGERAEDDKLLRLLFQRGQRSFDLRIFDVSFEIDEEDVRRLLQLRGVGF